LLTFLVNITIDNNYEAFYKGAIWHQGIVGAIPSLG